MGGWNGGWGGEKEAWREGRQRLGHEGCRCRVVLEYLPALNAAVSDRQCHTVEQSRRRVGMGRGKLEVCKGIMICLLVAAVARATAAVTLAAAAAAAAEQQMEAC